MPTQEADLMKTDGKGNDGPPTVKQYILAREHIKLI